MRIRRDSLNPMRALLFLLTLAAVTLTIRAADLNGTYKGTWSGQNAEGDFTLTIDSHDTNPKAAVSFTYSGEEIKCDVKSVTVNGSKVTIVYKFELEGTELQSTATGELQGKTLQGSYQTKSVSDESEVDSGTWKTTAQ